MSDAASHVLLERSRAVTVDPRARPAAPTPDIAGTQSVHRALSILRAFTVSRPSVSGAELVARCGYSAPTAHRLLRALAAQGYIVYDPQTSTYGPGPQIIRLSGLVFAQDNLVPLTFTTLSRLRAATGETAGLHWRMGDEHCCTQELPGLSGPASTWQVGASYPLVRGTPGRAMLLGLDECEIREVLAEGQVRLAPRATDALLVELDVIRNRGYALGVNEDMAGTTVIAVPFPYRGERMAAVSVAGPSSRLGARKVEHAAQRLIGEVAALRHDTARAWR